VTVVSVGAEKGLRRIGVPSEPSSLALSSDGKSFAAVSYKITVYDVTTGKVVGDCKKASGHVTVIVPGGRILLSTGSDAWVKLWDVSISSKK